jgi:hypothetical protein
MVNDPSLTAPEPPDEVFEGVTTAGAPKHSTGRGSRASVALRPLATSFLLAALSATSVSFPEVWTGDVRLETSSVLREAARSPRRSTLDEARKMALAALYRYERARDRLVEEEARESAFWGEGYDL